jgi:hypothetical protein
MYNSFAATQIPLNRSTRRLQAKQVRRKFYDILYVAHIGSNPSSVLAGPNYDPVAEAWQQSSCCTDAYTEELAA